MTLEELEIQLKEMRDEGATGDTEILVYSNSSEFYITNIDLYFPETRANYIEITVHEKF